MVPSTFINLLGPWSLPCNNGIVIPPSPGHYAEAETAFQGLGSASCPAPRMLLTSLLNCPVECLKGRRGQWCGGGYCKQRTADLVLREHTRVSFTVSITSAACVSVGLCSGSCRLRSRSQLGLCSRQEALSSLGFLVPWGCGAEVPVRLLGVTWTTFSSSRLPSDPGLFHTPAHTLNLLTQGEQASFQGSSEKTRPS